MKKKRTPPPDREELEEIAKARLRKEAMEQSFQNLRNRLGNAEIDANKGVEKKH